MMKTADVLRETSVGEYQVEQGLGYVPYDKKTGRVILNLADSKVPAANVGWRTTECWFNFRADLKASDPLALLSPRGVGQQYTIVQNQELCEIADAVISEAGARYESAGTLRNGALVWLLARYPEDINVVGDSVRKYILIYSSHDGSRSITVAPTPVRVVCWNTLSAVLDNKQSNKIEIRHSSNAKDRIAEAIRVIKSVGDNFDQIGKLFQKMSKAAVTERFVKAYLEALYPDPKGKDGKKAKTGHASAKRERITDLLFSRQAGVDGAGMRLKGQPTEYALFNAVSQYWQYESTGRVTEGREKDQERFFSNAMGGTQEDRRSSALQTLLRKDELMAAVTSSN